MTVLLLIAIIFVLAPVAQAYARRLNPPEVPGVNPRDVLRLREELEQLAAQVNRLQDEQSFLLELLTEGERSQLPGAAERPKLGRGREPGHEPGRAEADRERPRP